jgi:hypothetical protein
MIDSIQIRLHNLQRYKHLLTYLLDNSVKDMYQESATAPGEGQDKRFFLKIVEYKSEGRSLVFSTGQKLTSSHYTLGWKLPVGEQSTTVDFNFSIPKLIYGTNIIQFVPHKTEFNSPGYFDFSLDHDYKANQEIAYKRLMIFLRKFFKYFTPFGETIIDLNDIEIRRIDICWNQYFNGKKDALDYLNYQKRIKKKHLRITSKNQKSYATSVFFATRDYAAKIYHKGSEYRSSTGERKHHLKANRLIKANKGKLLRSLVSPKRDILFDVVKLGEHADKILRYEISFRSAYLSKIFRRKVFRYRDEAWQKRMIQWRECHRICQYATGNVSLSNEKREFWLSVFLGRVNMNNENTRQWAKEKQYNYSYIDLSKGLQKDDRKFYDWWLKKRDHAVSFRMEISEEDQKKNRYGKRLYDYSNGIEDFPFEARFSPKLLRECFRVFDDFREHFQVREKTNLSDAQRQLDLYNKNIDALNKMEGPGDKTEKKKVLFRGAKSILKHLEHDTLDGLVEKGIICRKTAYNYEKKFETLNFNFHTGSIYEIWKDMGFEEYHRSLCHEGLEKYLQNPYFG